MIYFLHHLYKIRDRSSQVHISPICFIIAPQINSEKELNKISFT